MAKTRKKKKTSTADAIHIDINSHNAKDHAKYRMMDDKPNKISKKDIADQFTFYYEGDTYKVYRPGSQGQFTLFQLRKNNAVEYCGRIVKITTKGLTLSKRYFDKYVTGRIDFVEMQREKPTYYA